MHSDGKCSEGLSPHNIEMNCLMDLYDGAIKGGETFK